MPEALQFITPANVVAAFLTLTPYLAIAFCPQRMQRYTDALPLAVRLLGPALLCIPYALVAGAAGEFHWEWCALYAALPCSMVVLEWQAAQIDPEPHGNWRDFLILIALGLAVDLRWFEAAWPAHLVIFNKILLLDAGIYGFVLVRKLDGTGFDLRLRLRDVKTGLREWVFYTPIALALGLALNFLHIHRKWPVLADVGVAWLFTFFFIAVPEELFFRGWMQNLLERRMGRTAALLATSMLFGLSHFNKRTANFNWQYVLLAAIAGVFYGRAWRSERRVSASAVTHATVDALWSLWLR